MYVIMSLEKLKKHVKNLMKKGILENNFNNLPHEQKLKVIREKLTPGEGSDYNNLTDIQRNKLRTVQSLLKKQTKSYHPLGFTNLRY